MAASEEDIGARLGTWLELIRRARIHKDLKFACLVFASYANGDGTNILCTRARLAVDLDVTLRTAERRLEWMREAGLIEMTARGNRRRGLADTYRLTLVPDLSEKFLEAPDPEAYRKLIGQVADANRAENKRKYRRKKAAATVESTDSTSDGRTPVDNPSDGQNGPDPSTDSTSDGWTEFQPTESQFSTDRPNSLTCEDGPATSHDYTLHEKDNLPWVRDEANPSSYRPHAREAATTPIQPTQMDPETAARYRKAADALMTLADFGLGIRAKIRDELGEDVPEHQVVIQAAERFATRRPA